MFLKRIRLAGMLILLGAALYPQASAAESFTSAAFLQWPRESQRGYFQSSIGMASLIARQNRKAQGDCIDNWYFERESAVSDKIRSAMRKFGTYHPHGVILAMIEKACGPLKYTNR